MGRAGFNEIIPALLYQRGQFLTWPAEQKHRALQERGVRVVVNLWRKVDPDLSGYDYINWPISPSDPPPTHAAQMILLLDQLLEEGAGMVVHCEAGRGRSAWLCTELVHAYTGMPYDEAYAYVCARVPGAFVRPELRSNWR